MVRQWRRFMKGTAIASTTLFFGGSLLFHEWKNFNRQLSLFPNVFDIEKRPSTYIYLHNQSFEGGNASENNASPKYISLARRLLSPTDRHPISLVQLLHSQDEYLRRKAIDVLVTKSQHWSDGDCLMLSQAIDLQTSVRLARTHLCDLRLLRRPPTIPHTEQCAVDELSSLIAALPTDEVGSCVRHFVDVAMKRNKKLESCGLQAGVWNFYGEDMNQIDLSHDLSRAADTVCLLQALLGHCQVKNHCLSFIDKGGMIVLRHIYDTYACLPIISRAVARVLASMSLHSELHDVIFNAGWVTILAEWLRSSDLPLSLLAAKTLANMDIDDYRQQPSVYSDSVFIYHPKYYTRSLPLNADIVFVHGLLGGPFLTWRQQDPPIERKSSSGKGQSANSDFTRLKETVKQEDQTGQQSLCWPKDWLAIDCPHTRMLAVEYETRLSQWGPQCPYELQRRTLQVRGRELLDQLLATGLGNRPIIWVGHSMGGLLIKQMLVMANEDASTRHLVSQSRGVVFYSVPHQGCSLADYSLRPAAYLLYPSVEVRELKLGSEQLKVLHSKFTTLMNDNDIALMSFAEGETTTLPLNFKATIVPQESCDPGFGEFYIMPGLNHLNICKPAHRDSPLYRETLRFIANCVAGATSSSSVHCRQGSRALSQPRTMLPSKFCRPTVPT